MSQRNELKHGAVLHPLPLRLASFDTMLLVMVLVLVGIVAALMGVQSDTWWQLRTGQVILSTGTIPTVDIFSSTVRGAYWPNHEWLSLVLFYGLYRLGGLPALFLGCAILVTLTWAGLAFLAEGPGRVRAAALLLGMAGQSVIWSVRPHIFSFALLVVLLLMLSRPRLHWLYPGLFFVWANLHAGVAFGGVALVVATLAAVVEDVRTNTPGTHWRTSQGLRWSLITLLSGLATLLNPLGIGLWRYVLESFGDTTRTYLSEWQPPNLGWAASYPFFVLVIVTVIAVITSWRSWRGQRDWTLLGLALLFGWLGFRSMRHTAFFMIVAVPLLTRPFRSWPVRAVRGHLQALIHGVLLAAVAVGGAVFVLTNWASTPAAPLSPGLVEAVRRCPGTLYNTYDIGGPLIWQVPERPVFVDNRQDPYPADLLFRAVLAEQQGAYRELFATYNVQCAVVPITQPLYTALQHDRWEEMYRDMHLAVLHHPAAQ